MENIAINKRFQDLHFDSIQALRGLAALFVVFQHIRFLNFGAFGVDIFFCISGFMIMFTTEKSTKYFFRKRLIRILPLYYLMTLVTYLSLLLFPSMFQQTRHNLSHLVKSLLFIPFDIGGGIIQPLVRIGWTINCAVIFHCLSYQHEISWSDLQCIPGSSGRGSPDMHSGDLLLAVSDRQDVFSCSYVLR